MRKLPIERFIRLVNDDCRGLTGGAPASYIPPWPRPTRHGSASRRSRLTGTPSSSANRSGPSPSSRYPRRPSSAWPWRTEGSIRSSGTCVSSRPGRLCAAATAGARRAPSVSVLPRRATPSTKLGASTVVEARSGWRPSVWEPRSVRCRCSTRGSVRAPSWPKGTPSAGSCRPGPSIDRPRPSSSLRPILYRTLAERLRESNEAIRSLG